MQKFKVINNNIYYMGRIYPPTRKIENPEYFCRMLNQAYNFGVREGRISTKYEVINKILNTIY